MTGDPPPSTPERVTEPDPAPTVSEPTYTEQPAAPARRAARWPLWLALVCLVVGGIASAWLMPRIERWWSPAPAQPVAAAGAPSLAVSPTAAAAMPITLEGLAAREAALDAQLRAIEARMAAADAASRHAAGNAMRAERILVATATRRELNRGRPLGHLEGQLRVNFAEYPGEVSTIIAASRAPVTLEDLRHALNTLAPTLASGSTRQGVWSAIKREVSGLVVVRRESTPSPRPADRLDRARRMIDAGNVEGALAEVARTPGAADATSWMDAAKRWIDARRALSTLEDAAMTGGTAPPPPAPAAPAAPAPQPDSPPSPETAPATTL